MSTIDLVDNSITRIDAEDAENTRFDFFGLIPRYGTNEDDREITRIKLKKSFARSMGFTT